MFDSQNSGNKISLGENYLNIKTHASPKVVARVLSVRGLFGNN